MPTQEPAIPTKQPELLKVMIRNREKVIFDGLAYALSSINNKGVFDVLPQHINFITMIKESLTIHKPDKTKQEFKIRTGLMRVNADTVEIYVGILPPQAPTAPTKQ